LGEDLPPGVIRTMERVRSVSGFLGGRDDPMSVANLARAYTATHREWMAADAVRARLRHEAGAVFDRWHVVLAPIAPVPAFPHDRRPFQRRKLKTSDGQALP